MKKLIIYSSFLSIILAGCTKDITEFNANPKAPEDVPAAMLYANAQKELVYYTSAVSVNDNTFRLWSQHWTQTTYVDESNYELTERNINGRTFNQLYADVLRDLNEARKVIEADELLEANDKTTQLAMIEILECYTYQLLVDIFNDVPYEEAILLLDNLAPKFDDAETIYKDVISRLKTAATDVSAGSTGELGLSDNIYFGDNSKWAAFAHSLRLKMAIRIGDLAEAADASAGAFASEADDALMSFESSPPNTNPMWEDLVQSGRYDFIASATLADVMNQTQDPRRSLYFKNLMIDSIDSATVDLNYVMGSPHGLGSAYNNNSQPGALLEDPTHAGQLITFCEVEFLRAHLAAANANLAEAAARYESAVKRSVLDWGGTSTDADAYYARNDVHFDSLIGDARTWQEVIATQKWVAMYDNPIEAWSTWRLYNYPQMEEAAGAGTEPPTRYNYSVDEYSVNATNVGAANGGKDDKYDKVFWDKD